MMFDPFTPAPFTPELTPWKPPSYLPSLSWRGFALVTMYTMFTGAIGLGAAAIGFEVDRASITGSRPVGTCFSSLLQTPSFCSVLADRIEQRDSMAKLAGASGASAAGFLFLFIMADTRAPLLVPAAGTDSAGFLLRGAW
jgi:hypothetical protein